MKFLILFSVFLWVSIALFTVFTGNGSSRLIYNIREIKLGLNLDEVLLTSGS
jgi:hypothetical protein